MGAPPSITVVEFVFLLLSVETVDVELEVGKGSGCDPSGGAPPLCNCVLPV